MFVLTVGVGMKLHQSRSCDSKKGGELQMGKYRKKPIIVEAIQFLDNDRRIESISNFVGGAFDVKVDYSKSLDSNNVNT